MTKKTIHIALLICSFLLLVSSLVAQDNPPADTFFLSKKKGFLGKLGKSISTTPPDDAVIKLENPLLPFKGKIIRNIHTVRLGFEYNMDDTNQVKNSFGISVAKRLHKNSSDKLIKRNLFFKEGDPLFPYLLADNERFLREQVYLKDARILVYNVEGSNDSVDVIVLTKDVFSIGGNFSNSSLNRGKAEIREENFMGSGTRLLLSSYYEKNRFPEVTIATEVIKRNIGGSFVDVTMGYHDYRHAFSSGRNQESVIYTKIEKPLVTPYIPSTGALEWSYNRTRNVYFTDSVYRQDYKYAYYNLDAWYGYSLDSKRALYENKEIRWHRFVALRGFKQHFINVPNLYKNVFNFQFADFTGVLGSLNIFKQVFYRTSYIYGFGRNEDIPEGFSMAFTAGYINKQGFRRPYSGIDISKAAVKKKGDYLNYTIKFGGHYYRNRFEDVDLLVNLEHFSRLRRMSKNWYQRFFVNLGFTAQANPVVNSPLFLNSEFGLPYYINGNLESDIRATLKTETVFYNTTRLLGFRFAPFIFADMTALKPLKKGFNKSDLYSAVGGGFRTRNENLVFGTIEVKGFYFPTAIDNMKNWRVEVSSNIRFRYISRFISRPDVIIPN